MSLLAQTYLVYLVVSVGVTIGVGHTLHKHGRSFLLDVFHGEARIADPVNHFLLVGFYLMNVAFVLFYLRSNVVVPHPLAAGELLARKLGVVLTSLGAMHFVNVAVLTAIRRLRRFETGRSPR